MGRLHRPFWSLVVIKDWESCWTWCGVFHPVNGRPIRKVANKNKKAYKVAYTLAYGQPSKEKEPHHICLNKLCVNPRHIVVLSHSTHIKYFHDMKAFGKLSKGWSKKLKENNKLASNNAQS